MKKLLLLLLALTVIPVSVSWSQDGGTTLFTGFRYDDGLLLSVGSAQELGLGLYVFEYCDVGVYGSLSTELAYLCKVPSVSGLKLGVLAGPNSDWIGEQGDDQSPINYIVGSGGVIGAYSFTDKFGAWAFYKYKFALDNNDFYQNGYIFGAGVFMGL